MTEKEFKELKEDAEQEQIIGINSGMNRQCRLGYAYFTGNGVIKNYKQAVTWFRKAAWRGCESSHLYLAYCYRDGTGVEKDLNRAAEHFESAAAPAPAPVMDNIDQWSKLVL